MEIKKGFPSSVFFHKIDGIRAALLALSVVFIIQWTNNFLNVVSYFSGVICLMAAVFFLCV